MATGMVELARTQLIMRQTSGMSSLVKVTVWPVAASKAWMRMRAGLAQNVSHAKPQKPSRMQPS